MRVIFFLFLMIFTILIASQRSFKIQPKYQQIYGEFLPYMSIVDLILNEGPKSLGILTGRLNK